MTTRIERYNDFENFHDNAKVLFKKYSELTPRIQHLDGLYSLCICPGGRNGGINKKEVEVFYGSRPFDSVTKIENNLQQTQKLEIAHGATLSYQRTDDGQVLCYLSPANSENYRQPEDFILLGIIKNPAELERKSKYHWKMFIAYMEVTCLDGKPSLLQKIIVFYLRNFKEYVVEKILRKRKASVVFGEILKYTLTVGLSGFIILLITWTRDISSSKQNLERHQEILKIYSSIEDSSKSTAESARSIKDEIVLLEKRSTENANKINASISDSNLRIEKAISDYEGHNKSPKNEK